jgi:K(+)-stimulated pyrophosphate-energized sodium pump
MKLLREAMRRIKSCASPRALVLATLALISTLLPAAAFAGEKDVVLNFGKDGPIYLGVSLVFGVIAILFAWWISVGVMKTSPGSEKMQEVGRAIREGALAYLKRQVMTMVWFVLAIAIGLFFMYDHNLWVSVSFIAGVAASYIAGYSGMVMAVNGNMRTANAALTSYKKTLEIAFRSGAVAGMVTVGMGLIGATAILWLGGSGAMTLLIGFGFGGSLAALFMRVGGGIFTKAADVGADLVGKVEAGIPEDDPRNPATIADNVGDNVGDCAGMAADVFESYEVTLVAAIVLGAATAVLFDSETWMKLILFALMARGIGIIASIVGIMMVKGSDNVDADPLKAIRRGFYGSALLALLFTLGLSYWMMGGMASKITTTRLTSAREVQFRDLAAILKARDSYAAEKKVATYAVTGKDIAGRPEVANIHVPPPQPGATGDPKESYLTQFLQRLGGTKSDEIERAIAQLKPLQGAVPVTAENAKKLAISLPDGVLKPKKAGDQPNFTANVDLADAIKDGRLDLVVAEIKISRPAVSQPGAPAQPSSTQTITTGPTSESRMRDDIKRATAGGNKFEVLNTYKVDLYVNRENELIVVAPTLKDVSGLQPLGYTPATAADVAAAQGKPGAPPASQAEIAFASHADVPWWTFLAAVAFGIFMAFAIEMLTDYYVSTHKRPTQEVAGVSSAGPAPMIIQGFAYAAESSVFMVLAIVVALLVPLYLFNPVSYGSPILSFYGIALVGLGLLTTTGFVLAMDTFGPISDNAQGVYEMSGDGHDNEYGQKAVQRLDAAGNTTKALTKGFAIATAVVAAVALFHSYLEDAQLGGIGLRLDVPEIFLGLLIGGAAPYLFSAFSINAVGRAAFQLINEVRRQFRSDPGIMAGTSKPNYGACVSIVTAAAQKELLGPGILAIFLPIAVAFGFSIGKEPTMIRGEMYNLTGAQALGGFLAGAILSGQLLAVLLANSGGMWDNAKKIIEDGLYGGKGSEAHKAGIVCDTVGDPFKDTAGPAMNPLIKVMNLVALLLAPIIIKPFGNGVLAGITGVSVLLLVISIYFSKRGSLSTEMMKATEMAHAQAETHHDPSAITPGPAPVELPPAAKKRITVEDDDAKPE